MSQATPSPSLPRRRLGKTNLDIPVIPFGTQGFGNNFGFVADEVAVALVKQAVALGVNHFDCARCYGDSLRKLGLALKEIPPGGGHYHRPSLLSLRGAMGLLWRRRAGLFG